MNNSKNENVREKDKSKKLSAFLNGLKGIKRSDKNENTPDLNDTDEMLTAEEPALVEIPEEPSDTKKKKQKKKKRRESSVSRAVSGTIVGVIKCVVYVFAVIAIGICIALFAVIPIANDVFAFKKEEKIVELTVPELATLNDISELLYENGLISYPEIFRIYATLGKDDGEFLAGDYLLSATLSYDDLLASFKSHYTREVVSITFPEGFTTDELIDRFVENGIGTREGFIHAINEYNWSEDYSFWFIDELMENGYSEDRFYRLDGYLYPDTYYFYTDSTEVEALAKLLANFDEKFPEAYRGVAEALGYTVDEIITLASIIEGEAGYLSEFSYVSSVFHNRLKNRSYYPYLDSDATIVYAILHDTGERPEVLTETTYDSPYNTYKNRGLPPGPISNPGYNAITYALYPKTSDYFYFVANNDGYSVFSETLAEHQQAIRDVANGTAISTIFLNMQGDDDEEYEE